MISQPIVLFIFLLGFFQSCSCQLLSLELSAARFPSNISSAVSIFDGDDSIFVFGGQSGSNEDIFRYSISADTLSYQGTVADIEYGGSLATDSSGDIYYFVRQKVFKFYPGTLYLLIQVATLPLGVTYSQAVKFNETSDRVYFLGHISYKIPCFDLSTFLMCEEEDKAEMHTASAFVPYKGQAYVFYPPAFYLWPFPQRVGKIDLGTFELTYGPFTFPFLYSKPGAAVIGDYIYLVGGHNSTLGLGIPTNGLIKFDPETYKPTFLPVRNYMIDETQIIHGCSVVYVQKMRRIYIFGGLARDKVYEYDRQHHDEIWYIDVSNLID